MDTLLKYYFPMLRTKADILEEIRSSEQLSQTFDAWKPDQQEDFLELCTGVKGARMLYETIVKELTTPTNTTEQLEKRMNFFSESLKIHTPDSPEEIRKRIAICKEETRKKQKQLEEERRELMHIMSYIFRSESLEDFPLELYASLIGTNLSVLEEIRKKLKENPDMEDEELFQLLKPCVY